jgi:uncharacterized protein (DUF2062 family)
MKDFLKNKIQAPILNLLKEGLNPQELARALSLGCVIGVIPMLGTTVLLCAVVAKVFKLNQVAIQITNYAVYPLQFVLLIPFFRMGEKIFGAKEIPLNISEMMTMFKESPQMFMEQFLLTGLRGVVAWFLVAIPTYFLIERILLIILQRKGLKRG